MNQETRISNLVNAGRASGHRTRRDAESARQRQLDLMGLADLPGQDVGPLRGESLALRLAQIATPRVRALVQALLQYGAIKHRLKRR